MINNVFPLLEQTEWFYNERERRKFAKQNCWLLEGKQTAPQDKTESLTNLKEGK